MSHKYELLDEDKPGSLLNKDTSEDTNRGTEIPKEDGKYILYPMRWLICAFFTSSIVASGLGMVAFSPISKVIKETYGVTDITVTMLVLPYTLLFIPCIFPANYLIDNKGIVINVYIASVLLLIGAWVRMAVNVNFYFVLGGQVIMSCGQPFMLAAPAKIAALFFGDNERAIATTIGSLAGPIGAVIGFLLPLPLIKDSDAPSETVTKEHAESKFFTYILVQNIIITLLGLPIIFLIRNNPPTPPSLSAEKVLKSTKKTGQFASIWKLLSDRDFFFLLTGFSFIYSIYTTLGACVGPLSNQFNYSSQANSYFGMVYIFGGLFGAFTHAFLLDKYKKFKLQYILVGFLCIISMGTVTAIIGIGNAYITAAGLAFLGVSQLPIIGVAYSFTAEITYPVNEALSCGLLQLCGSIIASIFTFIVGVLLSNNKKYLACYVMIAAVAIGFFFQFFVRERLRRSKAGANSKSFSFHVGNMGDDIVVGEEEQGKSPEIRQSKRPEETRSGEHDYLME